MDDEVHLPSPAGGPRTYTPPPSYSGPLAGGTDDAKTNAIDKGDKMFAPRSRFDRLLMLAVLAVGIVAVFLALANSRALKAMDTEVIALHAEAKALHTEVADLNKLIDKGGAIALNLWAQEYDEAWLEDMGERLAEVYAKQAEEAGR